MLRTKDREQKQGNSTKDNPLCSHCGDPCDFDSVQDGVNHFCCTGCLTVYDILSGSGLSGYYSIGEKPGIKPDILKRADRFAYLDKDKIRSLLLDFHDGQIARITFSLPQIHCSSCVWLLENIHRLDKNIQDTRVDLPRRRLSLIFDIKNLPLSKLAELLASIGYEPDINMSDLEKGEKEPDRSFRRTYARIAVAGFCFGNVMLISFPRYFGMEGSAEAGLGSLFDYLKIILALPVIFYAALGFFKSAYHGLKSRLINMDIPISMGILILFIRSVHEILIYQQAGYIDSLTGLVFLLLVGRLYQEKTFFSFSFQRDHRSYLPIAVTRVNQGNEENIQLELIQEGDDLLIYNHDIIPTDSTLLSNCAEIDYSFVTGESRPVRINQGERLFAGGRLIGQMISIKVNRVPTRSYLLKLWEETEIASKGREEIRSLTDKVSRYFTPAVILIAVITAIYWMIIDSTIAWNAATAVLIVACPCALALSAPFALGTAVRLLGRGGIFLSHSSVIERMADLDTLVFDKTGTITSTGNVDLHYQGDELTEDEKQMIFSLVSQSKHPLSRTLSNHLKQSSKFAISDFYEEPGSGLKGIINGNNVKVGSAKWLQLDNSGDTESEPTNRVYISINKDKTGYFLISSKMRSGLKEAIVALSEKFKISLISGDRDQDRNRLSQIFSDENQMLFNQSPSDKLRYIQENIKNGKKVGMIGDGLNDAGALRSATVGLTILEEPNGFSPASDGIIKASSFHLLPNIFGFARNSILIVKISLGISFLYNVGGLFLAVSGQLSPVIAAALMPISSLTIVLFTTLSTSYLARQRGLV